MPSESPAPRRRLQPGAEPSRFGLTAVVLIVSLLAVAVGLTAANAVQGPQLRGVDVNPQALVSRVGQRLVLRLDQTIAEVGRPDVRITPSADFEVRTDATTVTLRFDTVLPNATTYALSIPVTGTTTGAVATLDYTFQTPAAEAYLLQRAQPTAPEAPDAVVRAALGSTESTTIHSEPAIQEYAVADPHLAVVTSKPGESGHLALHALQGGEPARTVVEGAVISQLHSSGPGGIFGFVRTTLSDTGGPNTTQLQVLDPNADSEPIDVVGLDGKPLAPQVWTFVPGTNSLVAQIADGSSFLVDPLNKTPIQPLGSHQTLEGFVPGTTTLVVADVDHYTTLDLSTGRSATLPDVKRPDTDDLARLVPLAGGRSFLGLLTTFDGKSLTYSVGALSGTTAQKIYLADPPGTAIQKVCLSPNGAHLAVEQVPEDAVLDRNEVVPGYSGTSTVFLETGTGRVEQTIDGSGASWCP